MSNRIGRLISVILYCGGEEALLVRTLESVARQTLDGLQLMLVVDSPAEDRVRHIARTLCGDTVGEIGVLTLSSSISAGDRNRAIAGAPGKHIFEISAGAAIEPTMLEKCVWALETRQHAGFALVRALPAANGIRRRKGLSVEDVAQGAYVFRKSAWMHRGGLDERAPADVLDRDFCLRMLERHWTAVTIPETLVQLYREDSANRAAVIPDGAQDSMAWLRAHHRLFAVRWRLRGLRARAQDQHPMLRSLERRIASKLTADELTDPRKVLRHPVASLLRLMPQRYKGPLWARWNLPRRPDAWVDSPPLLHLPSTSELGIAAQPVHPADQRPRVLVVHTHLFAGGVETVLLNLLTFIDHAQFDTHIITTDSFAGEPEQNPWMSRFARQTASIFHLPSFLHRDWYLRFLVDFIRSRRIDVLLISLSPFAYNSLEKIRAACPGIAIVDLLHAEAPYYPMDSIRLASRHRQYLDRRVVVTEALKSIQVLKYGETPERVLVIPNGIDTEADFSPHLHRSGRFRQSLGIADDIVIAMFFGRVVMEKQPMHIVEVAEQLRHRSDIVFVVLGDGPDKETVRRAIAERRLQNVVMGPSQDDIGAALTDADLVFFPSKREGLPMAGLEALAMGKPVVAANVPGWNGLISDGIDGFLIEDGDFEGYASAVARLADDPTLREHMGLAGRQKAIASYDVRDSVRAWERLLRQPRVD